MAQRDVDRLVDEIRLRRHRIGRQFETTGLAGSFHDLRDHMRQHRLAWTVGGAAVGLLAVPLLVPLGLRFGLGMARRWAWRSLTGGVFSLAQGLFWGLIPAGATAATAEWDDLPDDDTEPPLQATGGPIQPLSGT